LLGFASSAFVLIAIYVLARADGWSRKRALLVIFGFVAVPFLAVSLSVSLPLGAFLASTLPKLAGLGLTILLFALAMSVSNKVSHKES